MSDPGSPHAPHPRELSRHVCRLARAWLRGQGGPRRQHRERDRSPKEGWQREGCVSDRSMHGAWSQPTTTSSLQLTHPRVRKTPHHETVHPPLAVGKWANGNIK
ncbi:hypothetical protein VNO80_35179 [Phaseolus coccineus]|uniref:Uncharacterized protein n=1 Tax=Phaseolus coccineus TaxID=3886 RepID=A0AAN9KQK2_PHACN